MIEQLSSRDCVSIVALGREIVAHYGTSSIDELAKVLNVSLSTESLRRASGIPTLRS